MNASKRYRVWIWATTSWALLTLSFAFANLTACHSKHDTRRIPSSGPSTDASLDLLQTGSVEQRLSSIIELEKTIKRSAIPDLIKSASRDSDARVREAAAIAAVTIGSAGYGDTAREIVRRLVSTRVSPSFAGDSLRLALYNILSEAGVSMVVDYTGSGTTGDSSVNYKAKNVTVAEAVCSILANSGGRWTFEVHERLFIQPAESNQ